MNSLFKVLFNFPSRYLSAIGLATVFSLRWSLPPALGCIPKQPDSEKTRSDRGERPHGPDTRRGTRPRSEGRRRSPAAAEGLPYVTTRHAPKARRFDAGLIPIHSPLLGESPLVSFPPLNNMLKFSGCSRLNSGRDCLSSFKRTSVARSRLWRERSPPGSRPFDRSPDRPEGGRRAADDDALCNFGGRRAGRRPPTRRRPRAGATSDCLERP